VLKLLKNTLRHFSRDDCMTRAAALAYYTVFALPPLLILLVTIAGQIWSPAEVQRALEGQFAGVVGQGGAQQVHQMIARGNRTPGHGLFGEIAGVVGLVLGATGAFLSLQAALNHAWEVEPDPKSGGVKNFITKRLLSLGMVLGLGFLLAVSLALTAAVTAFSGMLGGGAAPVIAKVLDIAVSLVVLGFLFSALFKFLPDAVIAWRDVWVGGLVTAVLFVVGKFVVGLYLGHSNPGNAFGAASALAVVLVWVYYAGVILLLGAEFAQEWATERGQGMRPKEGAVHVIRTEERDDRTEPRAVAASARHAGDASATHDGRRAAHDDNGNHDGGRTDRGGGVGDWILGLPVLYLVFGRHTRHAAASAGRDREKRAR
jgi:membrane protein